MYLNHPRCGVLEHHPSLTEMLVEDDGPGRRATVNGKQVLLDGKHLADAYGEASATMIADCIQYAGLPADQWPEEALRRVQSYLA